MTDSLRDFPSNFLWGSSTAAHQVEGANYANNWWAWEHSPHSTVPEPSGDAIDQYHRYVEDFALLAALGQNAHRLSIEWSRIEPAPGEWSRSALEHYRRVLGSLADRGLTGFVTLMHFTLPAWFAADGGWLAPDAVDRFGRYVERVAGHLGDLMPYACTINEPQMVAMMGYATGEHPPGHQDVGEAFRVGEVEIEAHRRAVEVLRGGRGEPRAGICLQLPAVQPARAGDETCEQLAAAADQLLAGTYVDGLRADAERAGDFVGVQYYSRMRMDPDLPPKFQAPPPPDAPLTLMGWEIYPDGLRQALHKAAAAGLPLVVTENGIATTDDDQRIDYIEAHLRAAKQAMDEGVDLCGFVYWSSFDNFEWAEGYRPTFGLIGIDREDGLRRVVRPSAVAYGRVARSGRIADLRSLK